MATGWVGASAWLGGHFATELVDLTTDLSALDSKGWWVLVSTFEGRTVCARFANVRRDRSSTFISRLAAEHSWVAPQVHDWQSSLDQAAYRSAVEHIRNRIAAGDFYQVNLCRLLSAPLPEPTTGADVAALAAFCAEGNPAPHQGFVDIQVDSYDLRIATSSPELFLRRQGDHIESAPIKGTAWRADALSAKDAAENIMIVDLVRNDLAQVCIPGSVSTDSLLEIEQHPGLFHLVSKISGRLESGTTWAEVLSATAPAGSVSGAPKLAALGAIRALEPTARGAYCGVIGWVDADKRKAELAVGIRTFFIEEDFVHFGTGAGITFASDSKAEWLETELKASRLMALASAATRAA